MRNDDGQLAIEMRLWDDDLARNLTIHEVADFAADTPLLQGPSSGKFQTLPRCTTISTRTISEGKMLKEKLRNRETMLTFPYFTNIFVVYQVVGT